MCIDHFVLTEYHLRGNDNLARRDVVSLWLWWEYALSLCSRGSTRWPPIGRERLAGRRRERISRGTGESETDSVDRFVVLLQIVRRASSGGSLRVRSDNIIIRRCPNKWFCFNRTYLARIIYKIIVTIWRHTNNFLNYKMRR